jgi:tRNA-modifying protein YgfZ
VGWGRWHSTRGAGSGTESIIGRGIGGAKPKCRVLSRKRLGLGTGEETFVTANGQAMTANSLSAEYAALKHAAGAVPLGHSSQIELTGADRAVFLNRLSTNKLDGLLAGDGCETFLTDSKGHVLAHLLVFARPESLVLRAVGGQAEKIFAHLDYYLIRDEVQLHDRSAAWSELLLVGPQARTALQTLGVAETPDRRLGHREFPLGGTTISIRCIEAEDLAAYLVSPESETLAELLKSLQTAGVCLCGPPAYEAYRIERGWPLYGVDITAENLAQEVGRDEACISFQKGCYLGQETIARIDSRGHVNRILVGLRFGGADVPAAGAELLSEGRPAGRVTSAAFSPDLGAAIALGYVRASLQTPGTRLDSPAGPATVVALPMR